MTLQSHLNIRSRCREYRVPLWQCPDFLFPIMGAIIIVSMIITYFFAERYFEPEVVVYFICGLTVVLLILGYAINKSFEHLAEANRIKSEFVRIASHQLRTPVTAIGWTIDLLKSERITDPTIRKQIAIIEESHAQMAKLITNLLEVNRIEEGRFSLIFAPLSLEEITSSVVEELKSLAHASNVKLTWDASKDTPFVFSDPDRMRLAVRNLVENAIMYINGKGEAWIKIIRERDYLRWEVRDTGVGIPKRQQKSIFSKFFRSDNIMRQQTRGNGLGLFITKAIIKAMGGTIGFSSKEGEGSTFWFRIPIISSRAKHS